MSDYLLPFTYCQKFKPESLAKVHSLSFQISYFQAYVSALKEKERKHDGLDVFGTLLSRDPTFRHP